MEVDTETKPNEVPNHETPQNIAQEKSPTPQPQDVPKKSKNDKSKRDDKNVDQFMKSLNSVSSVDEKLSLACKKYVQATDDNKKLQFYIKQSDKRYALLLKEKEQLQHEYNKTVLVKSKLENLCRELQKQNKSIKDESLTKIREEEERRKETQAKFQNTLSEITTLLQQNNEKNAKLRDDNIVITEKFKSVVQQYQLREQQVDKMTKQMNLESQLSDAKLQKAALEHQADKERLMSEMEQMKVTLAQYRAKVMELQCVETSLKGQLSVYTSKYDEFQNALVKSNQVFGRSKEQIDKMSKKILKLEKESLTWRKRWESSQAALLDMCGERQAAGRRLLSLQGLCRTLQAERTTLLNTLKEHNIERPPLPPPSPPQANPADEKVDAMAANCATLKQSIAHLQNQINVFTNKKEEEPKQIKTKKSKSKKNKSEKAQKEKSEEPIPEISAQEESAPEESAPEESAPEESALEESAPEESAPEESVPEECAPEEITSELSEVDLTIEEEKVENLEEKIEYNGTMESLIQAISMANIGLNELEVGAEEKDKPNGAIDEIETASGGKDVTQEIVSVKEVKETTEITDSSIVVDPKEIVEVKISTNEASVDNKLKTEES